MISFVKTNKIMNDSQYGFKENHSTSLALTELIDKISTNIDKRLITICVFIDFCKAFETIDHSILIRKLRHYGARGIALTWFENYLTNRQQYVYFNNVSPKYDVIKCGGLNRRSFVLSITLYKEGKVISSMDTRFRRYFADGMSKSICSKISL